MKEIHHLTLQDRQAIQSAIEEGKTKAEIGRLLGKDPCGISREIIRHREIRKRNTYNRKILCAKPVSYTHLDVYKRQHLRISQFLRLAQSIFLL